MSNTKSVAKLKLRETYFESDNGDLRFQKEKAYTGKYAKDGGFYYMKTEGFFSKFATVKGYRPS